ncbi:hypothetical protein DO72_6060 [Burkholderia pseudomallei]|nr:hypothetical protein DO72_6060 [Burkholderia pseudomallei]
MRQAVVRDHVVMDQIAFERRDECVASRVESDAVVDARVVDEPVDPAERRDRFVDSLAAARAVDEIDAHETRARLQCAQAFGERVGERAAAEHDRNRPFFGQRERDRAADARAAARHDHHLVVEVQVHLSAPMFRRTARAEASAGACRAPRRAATAARASMPTMHAPDARRPSARAQPRPRHRCTTRCRCSPSPSMPTVITCPARR